MPAVLATFVAGVGWLFCLSTLNVASQEVLPGWVRARGLALYLTAISAGIALGSALWGKLANVDRRAGGLRLGRARPRRHGRARAGAGGSTASPRWTCGRRRWRRRRRGWWTTRTPAARRSSWSAYEVRPEAEDEFLRALRLVGRVRRRTGATDWSVYRDADKPHRFVETFVLPSWDEHLRQHQRRTVTDFELQQDLRQYLRPGTEPTAKHYVAPPEPSMRLWLR